MTHVHTSLSPLRASLLSSFSFVFPLLVRCGGGRVECATALTSEAQAARGSVPLILAPHHARLAPPFPSAPLSVRCRGADGKGALRAVWLLLDLSPLLSPLAAQHDGQHQYVLYASPEDGRSSAETRSGDGGEGGDGQRGRGGGDGGSLFGRVLAPPALPFHPPAVASCPLRQARTAAPFSAGFDFLFLCSLLCGRRRPDVLLRQPHPPPSPSPIKHCLQKTERERT